MDLHHPFSNGEGMDARGGLGVEAFLLSRAEFPFALQECGDTTLCVLSETEI